MNERIKEIEDQCWEHEPSWTGVDKLVFNREKFAKLIAQECAELLEQQHTWISNVAASNLIRKHFGVEE